MSHPASEETIVGEATSLLRKQLAVAMERAGRVWHIVHVSRAATHFNCTTRVADALGVEPEGSIRPWGEEDA